MAPTTPPAVALALRLALGAAPPAAARPDWSAVFETARRERLAALAWLRSGAVIRERCTPALVAGWRAFAVSADQHARVLLGELARATTALAAAGVESVVLKGLPLAASLYGDCAARCTGDIDLFVAAALRSRAREALIASGWELAEGEAPGEEVFARWAGEVYVLLEVHSSITGASLAHLRVPAPGSQLVELHGVSLRAQAGPLLPASLAAHLAKHQLGPLLWVVDFSTLWTQLDDEVRREAVAAARAAGLGRLLAWAVRRASLLDEASTGSTAALRPLGFRRDVRSEIHPAFRECALSHSPLAGARTLGAWLWPRHLRRNPRATLALLRKRVTKPERRYLVGRQSAGPGNVSERFAAACARRLPPLDSAEVRELIAAVVSGGSRIWMRGRGESMHPTISHGDLVLLGAARRAPKRRDVVLTDAPEGILLHRISHVRESVIHTRGDATRRLDLPVTRERVLARAIAVSRAGRLSALAPDLSLGPAAFARYAAREMRARLGAALRRLFRGARWA